MMDEEHEVRCTKLLTSGSLGPDRQRSACADLLDRTFGQELCNNLVGGSALRVCLKLDCVVLALRGGGHPRRTSQ
jgi:hypothetical protein